MWLRRTAGAQREVVDGVESVLGEPFEVGDDVAKELLEREDTFEKAPKTVAAKAESAKRHAEAEKTGPGGVPADEVKVPDAEES